MKRVILAALAALVHVAAAANVGGGPAPKEEGGTTPPSRDQHHPGRLPDIVLTVVDDMGYHNLHAPPLHVNAEIQSPALAEFAREGVSLSNYYAYKYCGPRRASLLTGRYPGHGISEAMFSPAHRAGYNVGLTMLPAKLKAAGYRTAGLGKWHCGFWKRSLLPTSRGFDSWTGYLGGAEDHFSQMTADTCDGTRVSGTDLWQDEGNAVGLNGSYSGFTYTKLAVQTIEAAAGDEQPLFLYLAMHNIHGPDQVPPQYISRYSDTIYAARRVLNGMVSAADETVANVTAALKAAGKYNDTIMVIVSDNGGPIQEPSGGWSPGNNWPLRGGKYSFFEGGIKVVAMVRYPRAINGGRTGRIWDGLMSVADWYAVLSGLAGVDAADEATDGALAAPVDSIDVWAALVGGAESPRRELIIGMANGTNGAYRSGEMKLVVGWQKPSAWVGPRYPNASTPNTTWPQKVACMPGCLYNLTEDPQEERDRFGAEPAAGASLLERFNTLVSELTVPDPDALGPTHVTDPAACAHVVASGGWWGPWDRSTEV